MPANEYDLFLSHAWADGDRPSRIADALRKAGLQVWFDANEINDFESITHAVTTGLAKLKALLAYYSKTYPTKRACQWELTASFLAGQAEGDPRRRVLVINPENSSGHIHPIELRDAKFRCMPKNDGDMPALVCAVLNHLKGVDGPLANVDPLSAPQWHGMTPVGSTRFVGRVATMWELHSVLHAGDVAQITGAAASTGGIGQVHGLAGAGKSLLAEEYALRFGPAYPGGIFWLRAYGNDGAMSPGARGTARSPGTADSGKAGHCGWRADYGPNGGSARPRVGKKGKTLPLGSDDMPDGLNGQAVRR